MSYGGNGETGGVTPSMVAELARRAYCDSEQMRSNLFLVLRAMLEGDGGFIGECVALMGGGELRLTLAQALTELERLGEALPIATEPSASYVAAMDLPGGRARWALIEAVARLQSAGWSPPNE